MLRALGTDVVLEEAADGVENRLSGATELVAAQTAPKSGASVSALARQGLLTASFERMGLGQLT